MKIIFAISSQYYEGDDGVWTTTSYNNTMWDEYLKIFDEIFVLAPLKKVSILPTGCKRANNKKVKFIDSSAIKKKDAIGIIRMRNKVNLLVKSLDGGILHSPSFEAELAFSALKKYKKPYVVESRGEQSMHEGFLKARGIPFAKVVKQIFLKMHMRHLESAYGCIYVSDTLRERYAPKKPIKAAVISDLRLPDSFIKTPRVWEQSSKPFKIINVGNLSPYKDQKTLIKALHFIVENYNPNIQLNIVGKGPLESELKQFVKELGIEKNVNFHGFVSWGEELFSLYDQNDLFALSSLTEGMPRVVLESLARGLPVVSTEVSGSIEILPKECIAPVGDYKTLAQAIIRLMESPYLLGELSSLGINEIRNYREGILKEKKINYFNEFKEAFKVDGD
ncbi:glycosyltransferase family 4 protein [Bacillus paranthracis]|uniref:glycosyltransferase family 4 protein n=1 Tax=Bacillus paranthracis TaxID=2026186 RepID=UPI001F51105A|nr:glycosyltransferase family 4 protein [Bacillus paranthracis]MBG9909774.1 glycosyl transferase family 1 [Bacillus paranthracis]